MELFDNREVARDVNQHDGILRVCNIMPGSMVFLYTHHGIKMAEWEYQRGDICFQLPEKGNYVLVITHLACNIVVKQILYGVYL